MTVSCYLNLSKSRIIHHTIDFHNQSLLPRGGSLDEDIERISTLIICTDCNIFVPEFSKYWRVAMGSFFFLIGCSFCGQKLSPRSQVSHNHAFSNEKEVQRGAEDCESMKWPYPSKNFYAAMVNIISNLLHAWKCKIVKLISQ